MEGNPQPRVLIFIVAYNAETTIRSVLTRIPVAALPVGAEVLIIDDQSRDRTFDAAEQERQRIPGLKVTVLSNPKNRGYGGNQKLGYQYAIREGFDVVALLHGNGRYAPECLPDLLSPVLRGEADACFGSRMMEANGGEHDGSSRLQEGDLAGAASSLPRAESKGARVPGMPLYKHAGNRILTAIQNRMLGAALTESHSGYRVYAVKRLAEIPFEANTDDYHFDTEIIIQFVLAGLRICERPIPSYHGDEIRAGSGLVYAANVMKANLACWVHRRGLLYQRKYDVGSGGQDYDLKTGYASSHTMAAACVPERARVLDLACGKGRFATLLAQRGCRVTGVDVLPAEAVERNVFEAYHQHNLDDGHLPENLGWFDYILCLDCIEHLKSPEAFLMQLRRSRYDARTRLVFTTGNIGFLVTRLGLLLGQFNYGRQGILDLTHTRVYTFASFRALLEQHGYEILKEQGVPAPFPKALGLNWLSRSLVELNRMLIALWPTLFSYQILVEIAFVPTLDSLLAAAEKAADDKRGE